MRSHDKRDRDAVIILCDGCSDVVWAGIVRSRDKHDKGAVAIHCYGCSSVLLCSGRCYEVT